MNIFSRFLSNGKKELDISVSGPNWLLSIPQELLVTIFVLLDDDKSRMAFMRTCNTLFELTKSDVVWKRVCWRHQFDVEYIIQNKLVRSI
jgi:hypothetical protein